MGSETFLNAAIELCISSVGVVVERWLFCIEYLPCLVSLWCMFEGSVEV